MIQRLNAEVTRILAMPEVSRVLEAQGLEPAAGPPEALAALLAADLPRFRELVRLAGATDD